MKPDLTKIKEPKPRRGSRHRRLPGPSKRTIEQREADLAFVADALVKGWAQRTIAEALTKERPYTVTRDVVKKDVAEVTTRWRLLCVDDVDSLKAEHLAKLLMLERKAWERIEALEQGAVREVARKTKYDGKKRESTGATKTIDKRDTTAVWLRAIQYCLTERAKILGLYAPVRLDAKGAALNFGTINNNTQNNVDVNVTITTAEPLDALTNYEVVDQEEIESESDEPSEAEE